eukprot:c28710_g1_i1 orf=906-4160(-)
MWRGGQCLRWKSDSRRKGSLGWMLLKPACDCVSGSSFALASTLCGQSKLGFLGIGRRLQSGSSACAFLRIQFHGRLHTVSASPHHESVSTIDAALCSLPVLTNHMRQFLPMSFLFDSVDHSQSSVRERIAWPEHLKPPEYKALTSVAAQVPWSDHSRPPDYKALMSVAEAIASLDVETENFVHTPVQSEDSTEGVVSGTLTQSHLDQEPCAQELKRERLVSDEELKQKRLMRRQRKIETDASLNAIKEYKNMMIDMCKKKLAPNLPYVKSLLLSWFEPFRDAILAEQKAIHNQEFSKDRANYGPYLVQLPADMLAVLTMHRLMSLLMKENEHGCIRLVRAAIAIGEAVEQEVEIYRILNKRRKKRKLGGELEVSPGTADFQTADTATADSGTADTGVFALQMAIQKMIKQQKLWLLEKTLRKARISMAWGSAIQAKVGTRLIELMTDVALVHPPASQTSQETPDVRPALKHAFRTYPGPTKRQHRVFGVISCDSLVWRSLENSVKCVEMPYMPMLVKPRAWQGYTKGGYLVLRSRLMRTHGARSQQIAVAKSRRSNLQPVFEALNALGMTPWRINKRVHGVIEKIWAEGGALAGMVERADVPVPVKPDTDDEAVLKAWRKEAFIARRTNSERHAQCCDTELKLSVARKYRDEEMFYYPHNLDFRGRAYPMHPHLNHLGSDMSRGLLEFAEARPLGATGLQWLKIQLANVYAGGVDKLSFGGRIAFVDENIDNIMDSAMQPLEGDRWWLNAEAPFQCLAACMNFRDALESGDVEKFCCHLPVQQDGSCNGLQHYAALGRDKVGAESVNLTRGDAPSDVYSGIASRVKAMMESDSLKDPGTNRSVHSAQLLVNHVDRKLVKQTVMTSVYGVTFVGARCQILNRLEERESHRDSNEMFLASSYAAKTTLAALGEMFKGARLIMAWLADCAKLIASENEPVRWTTPLGLPVVQPYRKPGWRQVKTSLQVLTLRNDSEQPVAVQRQKSAFPPNFVHSLDSTHMMLTATACHKAGLNFAGVHDSFWTHAGDVEKLNQILREKFVEMYKQPILENLLKSFQESFPALDFPPVPQRGDFDINKVLNSPYFFN